MFALYLACTCLICVILQRYFGDINGLSSSTPLDSPPFTQLFYGTTTILERCNSFVLRENSYREDDSFIRDKLNVSLNYFRDIIRSSEIFGIDFLGSSKNSNIRVN